MYVAHIRTILNENFANDWYAERGLELQNLIKADVQADPNTPYNYDDFIANLNNNVDVGGGGPGGGNVNGIINLMNTRSEFLSTHDELTKTPPTISTISTTPSVVPSYSTANLIVNVEDASYVYLAYRFRPQDRFVKVQMLDDGNHNDGLANDGVYGVVIPNSANVIDYYLYADNDSAGVFSPVRAAYEFYNIQSQLQVGDVVINEVMSNNVNSVTDASGKFEDWIELYNTTSSPISTSGLFLTDTLGIFQKWELPNQTIPANGYAIIWADEDGSQGEMHANFKLSNLGEQLILSNGDSLVIDSITFLTQGDDVAFARFPNGSGPFIMKAPTFNANNDFINAIIEKQELIKVYPNPFSDIIKWNSLESVAVRDILGQLIYTAENTNRILTSSWNSGIYFIHLKSNNQTIKVIKIQ